MNYISTRNNMEPVSAAEAIARGMVPNGGLFVPEAIPALDAAAMARIMRGSLEAICQRGKAQEGDKTMVDAFAPAVRALEANQDQDLVVAMDAAAAAAKDGAELTRGYIAKFGRSRYMGERALGHLDAGAVSVSILFQAMSDYLRSV